MTWKLWFFLNLNVPLNTGLCKFYGYRGMVTGRMTCNLIDMYKIVIENFPPSWTLHLCNLDFCDCMNKIQIKIELLWTGHKRIPQAPHFLHEVHNIKQHGNILKSNYLPLIMQDRKYFHACTSSYGVLPLVKVSLKSNKLYRSIYDYNVTSIEHEKISSSPIISP